MLHPESHGIQKSQVSPDDMIIFACEKEYNLQFLQKHRTTEYRRSLEVELVLVILIQEWTPTFAIRHPPSTQPLTRDERELADSQKQYKKMDTHPGIITQVFRWFRLRHSWIPRDKIHVRSKTEKIYEK